MQLARAAEHPLYPPYTSTLPEWQGDPEEIARQKVEVAAFEVSGAVFVEDTSLSLEALNGLPGPYIKWALDTLGLDGINALATHAAARHEAGRAAYAQTIIAFSRGAGCPTRTFVGRTDGWVVPPRQNGNFFGWDPIFQPTVWNPDELTYAEMGAELKNKISHRSRALARFSEYLRGEYLEENLGVSCEWPRVETGGEREARREQWREQWLDEWKERVNEWLVGLPASTASAVKGCGIFLGGVVANRFERWLAMRRMRGTQSRTLLPSLPHMAYAYGIRTCHTHMSQPHVTRTCHTHVSYAHVIRTFYTHRSHAQVTRTCHTHRSHAQITRTCHTHMSPTCHTPHLFPSTSPLS